MLPGFQGELRDWSAFHKSAVRGAKVFKHYRMIRDRDFAMMRGDGRMIDGEIVLLAASDAIYARLKFNFPGLRSARVNE